jgi:hypothetical protein
MEIYLGTSTQSRSPTIQAVEGADIPAFRDRAYIVFRDLPLEQFNNRIPQIDVEVIERTGPLTISSIIEDICIKAGLSEDDLNIQYLDTPTFDGFWLNQTGDSYRGYLEDLQQVFLFVGRERQGILEFFPYDRSVSKGYLNLEQLGVKDGGNSDRRVNYYTKIETPETELPAEVQIEFKNIVDNHNDGIQIAYRSGKTHDKTVNFKGNIVSNDGLINQRARKILEYLWQERYRLEGITALPLFTPFVHPGDRLMLDLGTERLDVFIKSLRYGANYQIEFGGVVNNLSLAGIVAPSVETDYQDSWDINYYADPIPVHLDINLVKDTHEDFGVYVGLSSPNDWAGGQLFSKYDGGEFTPLELIPFLITEGTVATPLPPRSPFVVDRGTVITLKLTQGELFSVPDFSFLALDQILLVGEEMVAFRDADLISEVDGIKTYHVSHLLRGVRGTEWAIAGHSANETAYLLDTDFYRHVGQASDRGKVLFYKGVPLDRNVEDVAIEASIAVAGNALKPYSPVNPRIIRRESDNARIIEWTRRTRKNGQLLDGIDAPLEEASEAYLLKIIRDGDILREVMVSTQSFTYTESMMLADYGFIPGAIAFSVQQVSGYVGAGYPLEATLFPSAIAP